MSDTEQLVAISLICGAIVAITILIWFMNTSIRRMHDEINSIRPRLSIIARVSPTYTKDLLSVLDAIIQRECEMRISNYLEEHIEDGKITRTRVKNITQELCKDVHNAINDEIIQEQFMIVKKSYLDSYIIRSSTHYITNRLIRFIDENA